MEENEPKVDVEAAPPTSSNELLRAEPTPDAAELAAQQLLTLANAKPRRKRPNQHAEHLAKYRFRPNGPDGERDERINRAGRRRNRPQSFTELRELAQEIAHRPALDREGQPIVDEEGNDVSMVEMILALMAENKFQYEHFLQIAFGKVPDELEVRRTSTSAMTDEQRAETMKQLAQAISLELSKNQTTPIASDKPGDVVDGTVAE